MAQASAAGSLLNLPWDAVEADELCISKKQNLWLWTAVSRYTGQVLAWLVGDRRWACFARLWQRIPEPWQRRLFYTDGYEAYAAFLGGWQHRVCQKGDGGTCTVEGVNQSLRHRCAPLVRKTSAKSRLRDILEARIAWAVEAHNRGGFRRMKRRARTYAKSTQGKR